MKHKGDNCFREGHLGKDKLRREGMLVEYLTVPEDMVQTATNDLHAMASSNASVGVEGETGEGTVTTNGAGPSNQTASVPSMTELLSVQMGSAVAPIG